MKSKLILVFALFGCLFFLAQTYESINYCQSFTGDAGAQLNSCIGTGVGFFDARNLTGTNLAINGTGPIPASNPHGELWLGQATFWLTSSASSIVIPSRFHVFGIGESGSTTASTDYNTIFRACNGETTGTPCGGGSFPSNTPIFCFGTGGTCGAIAGNNGQVFDSWIKNVLIDCNGVSGCIGVQNKVAQENSGVFDAKIANWGNAGIGLQVVADPSIAPIAPGNSSYSHLEVQNNKSMSCTAGAVAILVIGGVPKLFDNMTLNSPGCTSTVPSDNMRVSTNGSQTPITIHDIHVETATNGVSVGCDSATQGVILDSIGAVTTYQINICNTYSTGDILIRNVVGSAHLIKDQINGHTLTSSGENGAVALYYLGGPGTGIILTTAVTVQSALPSFQLIPGSLASFGTCNAATFGTIAAINNSNTVTWGAPIGGGGGNNVGAFCDGSNWTVFAQ